MPSIVASRGSAHWSVSVRPSQGEMGSLDRRASVMGASGLSAGIQVKESRVSSRILSSYGELSKVQADVLALANGKNQQVTRAGPGPREEKGG